MSNQLDALQKLSSLAIHDIDTNLLGLSSATHVNISTRAILSRIDTPQFSSALQKAIHTSREHRWDGNYVKRIRHNLMLNLARDFNAQLPGQASIELDAELAFDTEGLINQASGFYEQYRYSRANTAQLLIKIPATWEGITAARELQRKTINTHLTMVYSFIQAQAGADSQTQVMSIPVGPASNWYQREQPQEYSEAQDPGVTTLSHIYINLKYLAYPTQVRACELTNIKQIQHLAGCDQLELSPLLVAQLKQESSPLERTLEKVADTFERPPTLLEKDFRWHLTMNAMAHEKLAQDIRALEIDQQQLESIIKEKIESL